MPRICRQKLFFLMKRSVPPPLSKNHRTKRVEQVCIKLVQFSARVSGILPPLPYCLSVPTSGTAQGSAHRRGFQVVQQHCNISSTHLRNGRAPETWLTMFHYRNYNKRQKLKKSLFKILQTVATNLQQY